MNFKKLAFWTTLFTTAAVPLATAQNPVILQGNYVSNVFGQSNFVLNPNAQTNLSNTSTTAGISLSRSTTTPLVATSEFTLSTTSFGAGVHATWTLRAFDQGMKGQNCEARFSYRGFATATTKAELVQNSLVVASLTLTASTDPRIASINFPCGDLTNLTTFRIAQTTANMTGTNEIGGIYVGLATNQANVAQAEFVGGYRTTATTTTPSNTSGTLSNLSGGSFTATLLEKATSYDAASGSVTFSYLPAGTYQVVLSAMIYPNTTNQQCRVALKEDTSGDLRSNTYQSAGATGPSGTSSIVGTFLFTSGASRTFRVQTALAGTGSCIMEFNSSGIQSGISVYRFPTSSELVVTPERQNTWGGVRYYGSPSGLNVRGGSAASTTYSTFNSATWTANRTLQGKCAAPTSSGDDVGCSIPNMPVGSYKIDAKGLMYNVAGTAGSQVTCSYEVYETTTTTSVHNGTINRYDTSGGVVYQTGTIGGVFNNTSVATRNFVIRAAKTGDVATGNTSTCNIFYSNSGSELSAFQITVTPLDQPSNSALYVQGPVLGSQTGAAIPAGYVGQVLQSKAGITNISSSAYTNLNTVTLTNGVWLCSTQSRIMRNGATVPSSNEMVSCIGNSASANCNVDYSYQTLGTGLQDGMSLTYNYKLIGSKPTVVRYDGTNFTFADGTVSASATGTLAHKVYADATSGQLQAYGFLECVRLN